MVRSEAFSKAKKQKGGANGVEEVDEEEVEKTFRGWLSRPDGWAINSKMKWIILLEFTRTSDTSETYYSDMKSIAERQHAPILKGLNAFALRPFKSGKDLNALGSRTLNPKP